MITFMHQSLYFYGSQNKNFRNNYGIIFQTWAKPLHHSLTCIMQADLLEGKKLMLHFINRAILET